MCLGNTFLFASDELPDIHSLKQFRESTATIHKFVTEGRFDTGKGGLASCIYTCGDSIQLMICFSTIFHSDSLLIISTSRLNLVFYYLVEMSLCGFFLVRAQQSLQKILHQFVLGTLLQTKDKSSLFMVGTGLRFKGSQVFQVSSSLHFSTCNVGRLIWSFYNVLLLMLQRQSFLKGDKGSLPNC